MNSSNIYQIHNFIIACVWAINGLLCKVLDLVPRHEQIVAKILGYEYSRPLTVLIGISEILMACWILSRFRSRLNAFVQMAIVAIMNTLEFILAPELLLWGKFNSLFAFIFILVVYYNEFYLHRKMAQHN